MIITIIYYLVVVLFLLSCLRGYYLAKKKQGVEYPLGGEQDPDDRAAALVLFILLWPIVLPIVIAAGITWLTIETLGKLIAKIL